jgi:phosphoribosylaminoimidazolecarboxamide formyltransferase/IMP cyclohydrolase
MTIKPIKRALLSVSDKSNIVEFATELVKMGVEIISTGGTSNALQKANIAHRQIDDLTNLPEMLDGRVKTLHPKVHGGILGRRDVHADEAVEHNIEWIDLVVVNFYPFTQAVTVDMPFAEAIEYIDVGGPTMVRAAAKNCAWVGVVTDVNDYDLVLKELKQHNGLSAETRRMLATKVFVLTASYDAAIRDYLQGQSQSQLTLELEKLGELRYGENPHQKASAYHFKNQKTGVLSAKQHQGKPLSYNNILDAEAAWTTAMEFTNPACVVVKHANPCGVASATEINQAYQRAYQADALSAFGGIIALNRPCTKEIAVAVCDIFMEVILAPGYDEAALDVFATKPNLRVLELQSDQPQQWEMKFKDLQLLKKEELQIVTKVKPSTQEIDNMEFAWRVLKHIKSNGILIAKDYMTVGIGAGQVSRVDAVDLAIRKAGDKMQGSILASDAFFPFRDSIDKIAKTGVKAIVQPGGSVRDEEVIAACDEHGIAMVFTGKRCFRH